MKARACARTGRESRTDGKERQAVDSKRDSVLKARRSRAETAGLTKKLESSRVDFRLTATVKRLTATVKALQQSKPSFRRTEQQEDHKAMLA